MRLRSHRLYPFVVAAAVFVWGAGCTLDKQEAPALTGPSGFGLSVAMSATPDVLPRDGASVSVIQLTARDAENKPAAGLRFLVTTSAGQLSESNVVTDAAGQKTFAFVAPALNERIGAVVTLTATPIGTNFDNSLSRRALSIRLLGPDFPGASFTFSPAAPGQYDRVTFDASGSVYPATGKDPDGTWLGPRCGTACIYTWDFGDGTTGAGLLPTHHFQSEGVFRVSLTVISPDGTSDTASNNVTVGKAKPITPVILYSPTDVTVDEPVIFDGRSSTTPDSAPVVDYQWDFGNGTTGSGETAVATFSAARTYVVRLTIRDAFGRTATVTTTVAVKAPVVPAPVAPAP